MNGIEMAVEAAGTVAALLLLAALLWSIMVPQRRLWPARRNFGLTATIVWLLTIIAFGSALLLGIMDWSSLAIPGWLRWGVGLTMIVVSNVAVWSQVFRLGLVATSGVVSELETGGLYRYSRNPQYVADIFMLAGWFLVSASVLSLPVVVLGIAALAAAPFAEEPWLEAHYGDAYRAYRQQVGRYL
jgi:protein-S-isoprenylcysteine O-methyltransferase Ste14